MTREEVKLEYAGIAHDHLSVNKSSVDNQTIEANKSRMANAMSNQHESALSTIAILKRHPMYDSLILVKRYRDCLKGYTLEFPTSDVTQQAKENSKSCCKTKLVSLYLDGDDPIYQCQQGKGKNDLLSTGGETVYVPMNGLMDRLDSYERHGISIDSRVYAFAMGLKTAEKFMTISSVKEIQETPPL